MSTPEGVDLDLVVAGLGSRFMSSIVDTAVQVVVMIPLALVAALVEGGAAIAALGFFLTFFGYPTVCDAFLDGRTLGRRATGLRLVTDDGGRVGFLAAAVRNIVRVIDFFPAVYAIGTVVVVATTRGQRLGDLAAGTLVVRAAPARQRSAVPGADRSAAPGAEAIDPGWATGPTLPEGAGAWDLTRVTADDVQVVRAFLARRHGLDPAARHRVGSELARRLRPAVVGPDPGLPDELLLEQILAVKAARA